MRGITQDTIIVVVACHFENQETICKTTRARLEAALQEPDAKNAIWYTTGSVPYVSGSPLLSELMKKFLMEHGISKETIFTGAGYSTFSDAEAVMADIAFRFPRRRVVAVSSDWFWSSGIPVYGAEARRYGIPISFIHVANTGGSYTHRFYCIYGYAVRLAFFFRMQKLLAVVLERLQSGRKNGFTWDGCR